LSARTEVPAARTTAPEGEGAVVLFDGVCNLCNASVLFVIDRDPAGHFRFAPLQSGLAAELLRAHGGAPDLDSIVLVEGGRLHTRSSAALRIARRLSGAWPLLYGFVVVPAPIRDRVYACVARNRYRWFGRTESCRLPTPELARRFLATEIQA
jgi:predicted DCC family thiol-disulfide oxidoreductase YuxK